MKPILIIVSLFLFQLKTCQNNAFIKNSEFQVFEGFLMEEPNSSKIFLQDHQDGDVVELKFYYDSPEGIDFDEFNFVEVKGYYNAGKNKLLVDELYPLTNQRLNIIPENNSLASTH